MCHSVQEFTFLWLLDLSRDDGVDVEAAAATLHSMAGRLTALNVPRATPGLLPAIHQTGAALSKSLTSLSFILRFGHPEHAFHSAAQAVRGLAAGLQRVELGLIAENILFPSAAEVQAADAAFKELICSLPSCQHLNLSLEDCVSSEAEHWALLHHAPHLLSVGLQSRHNLHEQVNFACVCCICHQFSSGCNLMVGSGLHLITRSHLNSVLNVALINCELVATDTSIKVHCSVGVEQADAVDSVARPEYSHQQQPAGPYQRSATAPRFVHFSAQDSR